MEGTGTGTGAGTGTSGSGRTTGSGADPGAEATTGAGPSPRAHPHPHPHTHTHPPRRRRHRVLTALAVALLLVPAVVVDCRLLGTDAVTPVPQLLSFLPWLAVPSVLGLVLAGFARRWVLAGLAVVVLAATGWAARPYGPDRTTASGPVVARLKVLSSNVEFGQATDGLIDTVRRTEPDLVFVSECEYACTDALAARLGGQYPYRAQVEAVGSSGSALISRRPLTGEAVVPGTLGMPGATLRLPGGTVRVQLAHPMPPLPSQVGLWQRETRAVRDAVRAVRGPVLVAGDFNASQDHAAFRDLLDTAGLHDSARLAGASRTPSWPNEGVLPAYVQIDHVLVSDHFSVRSARFLDLAHTDHRALLVELDLHERA
ncbi:endonuclease/exonuclease/phosphatase family protein [Streptomyces sp. NPDC001941]|uniref:endonuclease/exonuclease/phosphatase family protein n=1 Tax=Streptomyces sp. NPDC001941 TaxID=3154659 RepID=UPI00331B3698